MLRPVLSATEIRQIQQLFDTCRKVVITCHTSPDGDAIGSSLALYDYLRGRGKQVSVIAPNYFPDFLKWMSDSDKILLYDRKFAQSKQLIHEADLVVCLDFNSLTRVNNMQIPLQQAPGRKLVIDHHEQPEDFADVVISHPEMSSTCELLYRIFDSLQVIKDISLPAAEDLYAGMCTDTGRFSYNSNDPEIFIIIAELMRKGIDKDRIIRNIYNQNTEGRYRLMGYVLLQKLMVYHDLHASIFAINREELKQFHYLKGDAEGLVNIPLEIKGQKVSISLREDTEKPVIFVSIRSYDDFPANEMAQRFFNGGGHFNAAGGRLYCPMEDAVKVAKRAIEAFRPQLTQDDRQ